MYIHTYVVLGVNTFINGGHYYYHYYIGIEDGIMYIVLYYDY